MVLEDPPDRNIPSYLQDYDCSAHLVTSPHSLEKVLYYDQLSADHKSFVMNVELVEEPKSYHEAIRKPE